MVQDRCTGATRKHVWELARVRNGIGIFQCHKCLGHKWQAVYTYGGHPLKDTEEDHIPLVMGHEDSSTTLPSVYRRPRYRDLPEHSRERRTDQVVGFIKNGTANGCSLQPTLEALKRMRFTRVYTLDADARRIATELEYQVIIPYVPKNMTVRKARVQSALEVVANCDTLIAVPKFEAETDSDPVWKAIRYARFKSIPINRL